MSDVISTLTALAESVFREKPAPGDPMNSAWFEPGTSDAILRESQRIGVLILTRHGKVEPLVEGIFADPDLSALAPRQGELDPMILHPGGGSRASPAGLIAGLLASAFLQIYFLRLAPDEKTFVRIVLEGFEDLRRAAKGEKIAAYLVRGFAGITLDEGAEITTPWGTARPAPKPRAELRYSDPWRPQTSCLLTRALSIPIKVDRAPTPEAAFGDFDLDLERSQILFPLACALASKESVDPAVPLNTWSTLLLPFQIGFGYSQSLVPPRMKNEINIGERAKEVEDWSRILDRSHAATVDVAARRIISASGHRLDRSDALIDAVMVWENLFGTRAEVTFRVTAAIAKALEPDPTKRRPLQKSLAKIYDMRSRVVHGDVVDAQEVNDAATEAIDVGVRALRFCYGKGSAWLALKSSERADSLLLEEP